MATLASLAIPITAARDALGGADRILATDTQHVVKAAVAQAFGEGGLRPWRLAGDDGDNFHVVGWLSPDLPMAAFEAGVAGLGATAHLAVYEPSVGDEVVLGLNASPQEDVKRRDPATGKRRCHSRDVAAGVPSAREAYSEWIRKKVSAPRSGLEVSGDIAIRSTAAANGIYRTPQGLRSARIPRVDATVRVRVRDVGNYEAFLRRGIGPLQNVGYGLMVPEGA